LSPWLEIFRQAVADVKVVLGELPTRAEREPVVGTGKGGDPTTVIDARVEERVVERLEEAHRTHGLDFMLVSEELGERAFGAAGATRVVLDPIDGSLNAKRGIPFFSLSAAVAEGATMGDVEFAYVYDFGTGEEWTAKRGEGVLLDGEPLGPQRPKDRIEILSFEATRTSFVADQAHAFVGLAHRLRIMGSLAISLCHLAAGRVDAVCSLKPARAVDIAAGQLMVREQGYAIDLPEIGSFLEAPLDTEGHSRVVAAPTPDLCARVWRALSS
jgi:myo-inositol-1(or 4)-monophosphatase